ncbi:MAG: 6-bladed beta-propeller [Bacteroidaceae bacterium]|nr:6-bladed beta-propeller [Bacteroidaceae bacterium]
MKKHLFYTLLMLISLMGCSLPKGNAEAEDVEEGLPVINLSKGVEEVDILNLSDAAEKMEIVKLETTDKSLIKNIFELKVTGNDIWINSMSNILRFSKKGKFLNLVGKQGKGPGEYTWISKFNVDEINHEIYILSASSGILIYDYEGNFLRKITEQRQDELFADTEGEFVVYKNQFLLSRNLYFAYDFLLNENSPNAIIWSLATTDNQFNKLKLFENPSHKGREREILADEHIAHGDRWVNYWVEEPTSIDFANDEITIKFPDTDTIYMYNQSMQELVPKYAIYTNEEKGDYGLTHEFVKQRHAFDYFLISSYYATSNYVYLVSSKDEQIYTYAYNKRDHSIRRVVRKGEIINQEDAPPFISQFGTFRNMKRDFILTNDYTGGNFKVDYRSYGKYWIQVLDPGSSDYEKFVKDLKASPAAPQKQQLLDVIAKTDEEDNPILLIAVLK